MRLPVGRPDKSESLTLSLSEQLEQGSPFGLFELLKDQMHQAGYEQVRWLCQQLVEEARKNDEYRQTSIQALTLMNDRRFSTGKLKRNAILNITRTTLEEIFGRTVPIGSDNGSRYRLITWIRGID